MSRLIAITIIKNEENNYLKPWLENMKNFVDYHIFLDDASTDNTPQIIQEFISSGYNGELHVRQSSLFKENEPALRSELWEYTRKIAKEGDWILIVDADEFFEDRLLKFKKMIPLLNRKKCECIKASCLDMWTKTHYRADGYWSPLYQDIVLVAYRNCDFGANTTELHAPRYPSIVNRKKHHKMFLPKIHLAYLREADRLRRYNFYRENTPENSIMNTHALSILDVEPKLKPLFSWKDRLINTLYNYKIDVFKDVIDD